MTPLPLRPAALPSGAAFAVPALLGERADRHARARRRDALLDTDGLRRWAEAIVAAGVPGISVYVRHGEAEAAFGAGIADVRDGTRITPDLPFRMGSVTKTFTAT